MPATAVGRTVELGVYEQQAGEGMDRRRPCWTRSGDRPHVPLANGETLPATGLAERFGFDGGLQRTPIGLLSGG
jgi:ABC transport system ATP-binding/permease protein